MLRAYPSRSSSPPPSTTLVASVARATHKRHKCVCSSLESTILFQRQRSMIDIASPLFWAKIIGLGLMATNPLLVYVVPGIIERAPMIIITVAVLLLSMASLWIADDIALAVILCLFLLSFLIHASTATATSQPRTRPPPAPKPGRVHNLEDIVAVEVVPQSSLTPMMEETFTLPPDDARSNDDDDSDISGGYGQQQTHVEPYHKSTSFGVAWGE